MLRRRQWHGAGCGASRLENPLDGTFLHRTGYTWVQKFQTIHNRINKRILMQLAQFKLQNASR
jgi:hypothetical protein